MSLSNLPQYTFLSWYRKGLVNYVDTIDSISNPGPLGMPSIRFELELNNDAAHIIQKDIDIIGPGHIVGISERVLIKTFPQEHVKNAEFTNLAYAEFYDEDFPWRYTPAKPDGNRLRPWLSLLLLKEGEFIISYNANAPLPLIDIPQTILNTTTPNPALDIPSDNIWAWAHVQINKALQTDTTDPSKQEALTAEINALIAANPDVALSRLVSPRKLEPNVNYTAFIIPSFEVGRLAGLGQDASTTGVLMPSWQPTDLANLPLGTAKQMPFYYHWTFSTGEDGDFESLAKKLEPKTITTLPQKTINIESLGIHYNVPNTTPTLELGAALMPQVYNLDLWPNTTNGDLTIWLNIINDLSKQVSTLNANELEDPVVNVPPIYGQHYLNLGNVQPNTWLQQANLSPRDRAITGLGASIVKKEQETFMKHAWQKLGEIKEINKRIYQAQLGKEAHLRIFEKHLEAKTTEELVAQTGALHQKILNNSTTPKTIAQEIKTSNLNISATDSGFVKVRRTGGKTEKKLVNQAKVYTNPTERAILSEGLVTKINNNSSTYKEIQGSLPKASPYSTLDGQDVFQNLANTAPLAFQAKNELNLTNTASTLHDALNPQNTYPKKVHSQIVFNNTNFSELTIPTIGEIKPIMAAPKIELPLYQYLVNLSQDFIIPDIKDLGNNFVALLEVDQTFVEKVMLGANHEMSMELLWRGYPTDQRGTCFNYFWDTKDNPNNTNPIKDISDIHTWGNTLLGTHNPSSAGITALVIKGDLLEAYPNTVIYAHKAIFNPNISATPISLLPSLDPLSNTVSIGADRLLDPNLNNQTVRYPIFKAQLSPNVLVLGFDLSVDELLGRQATTHQVTLPGWFFMFKERPGEPRFGLDDNPNVNNTIASWDDLAWQHLTNPNYVDLAESLDALNSDVNWSEDAASMAHILFQSPVLMGIHASKVINS